MFALDQLARQKLRAQLDGVASERLGMRLQSTSPHRWSGKVPTDIVAKRVFSAATFEFKDDGLHFRVGQDPAAVGLVISGNIDLLSLCYYHTSGPRSRRLQVIMQYNASRRLLASIGTKIIR